MIRALSLAMLVSAGLAATTPAMAQGMIPPQPQAPAPELANRHALTAPPDMEVEAEITSQVTIPTEAEGWYTYGREVASVEMDFEERGLTGYFVTTGDSKTDKRSALTFFFAKTRVGGDSIYFATHEIHRTWYEFSGVVGQTPPKEKSLQIEYSLDGTLTTHRLEADGSDSKTSKRVKFKKIGY
jgi:hypothetical protein